MPSIPKPAHPISDNPLLLRRYAYERTSPEATHPPVGHINLTLQAETIEGLRLLATLRGESLSQTAEALFLECRLIEKVEAALQKRMTPPFVAPPRNLTCGRGTTPSRPTGGSPEPRESRRRSLRADRRRRGNRLLNHQTQMRFCATRQLQRCTFAYRRTF